MKIECPYCHHTMKQILLIYLPVKKSNPFHVGRVICICFNCWKIVKVPIISHSNYIDTYVPESEDKVWNQA